MSSLTQIVHFAGVPFLGKLDSCIILPKLRLRPLPLRYIQLCLLFFSALLSPIQADDFQSGLDAYHEAKYAEATVAFDRKLESSENAATRHNLALSLYQQGQATDAVWQLERALRLAPLNKTYIFKLGALRQILGLYDTPTDWWQSAANILAKKIIYSKAGNDDVNTSSSYQTFAFLGAGNDFLDSKASFGGEETASGSYFHGGSGDDGMYLSINQNHIPNSINNFSIMVTQQRQQQYSNETWEDLYKLSLETFVEETEEKKLSGAGAGLSDND